MAIKDLPNKAFEFVTGVPVGGEGVAQVKEEARQRREQSGTRVAKKVAARDGGTTVTMLRERPRRTAAAVAALALFIGTRAAFPEFVDSAAKLASESLDAVTPDFIDPTNYDVDYTGKLILPIGITFKGNDASSSSTPQPEQATKTPVNPESAQDLGSTICTNSVEVVIAAGSTPLAGIGIANDTTVLSREKTIWDSLPQSSQDEISLAYGADNAVGSSVLLPTNCR